MYETPGGTIYHAAHRAIEQLTLDRGAAHLKDELMPRYAELIYNGFWFSPEREMLQAAIDHSQAKVDGTVRLKLYKGGVHVTGRKSPHSLYSEKVVTFEDDAGAYDQRDAEGFIKLNALRLRLLGDGATGAEAQRLRSRRAALGRGRRAPGGKARPFVAAMILLAFVPLLYPPVPPLVDLARPHGPLPGRSSTSPHSPDLQQYFEFHWQPIGNLGVDLLIVPLCQAVRARAGGQADRHVDPAADRRRLAVGRARGPQPPAADGRCSPCRSRSAIRSCSASSISLCRWRWPCSPSACGCGLAGSGRTRLRAMLFVPISFIVFFTHTFGWGTLGLLCFLGRGGAPA